MQTSTWFAPVESRHPASPLLSVNHESQAEYLKHWLLFLPIRLSTSQGEDDKHNWGPLPTSPTFHKLSYFNPQRDTLYIGPINKFDDMLYAPDQPAPYLRHAELNGLSSHPSLHRLKAIAINNTEKTSLVPITDLFIEKYFTDMQILVEVYGDIHCGEGKADHPGPPTFAHFRNEGQYVTYAKGQIQLIKEVFDQSREDDEMDAEN